VCKHSSAVSQSTTSSPTPFKQDVKQDFGEHS